MKLKVWFVAACFRSQSFTALYHRIVTKPGLRLPLQKPKRGNGSRRHRELRKENEAAFKADPNSFHIFPARKIVISPMRTKPASVRTVSGREAFLSLVGLLLIIAVVWLVVKIF
jgi:hypothetical protein